MYEKRKEAIFLSRARGFTLIELMVTLAVLAIVLSFAVGGFTSFIQDSRINSTTSAIAAAIKLARNEAMSRKSVITIDNGGDWTTGLDMYTDSDANGNTAISAGANDVLIKSYDFSVDNSAGGIVIDTDDNNNFISFTRTGLLNEGGNARQIRLCDARGEQEARLITISATGNVLVEGDRFRGTQGIASCTEALPL